MEVILAPRSHLAARMFSNFCKHGWPATTLVTGDQTEAKHQFILKHIIQELFAKQRRESYSEEIVGDLVRSAEHPDYYYFGPEAVAIGTQKKSEAGSVRHLLRRFLQYAPRNGDIRFVYFADAAQIRNEAESALLKALEEPQDHTRFILSVINSEQMKETIVSRSITVSWVESLDRENIPQDVWMRFWLFSGHKGSQHWHLMQEAGLLERLKEKYDLLSFDARDFAVFDDFSPASLKKLLPAANQEALSHVCRLCFLPLQYALRDALIEGEGATEGAFRLPFTDHKKVFALLHCLDGFFQSLNRRVFGTRLPNLNAVFYAFLSEFAELWSQSEAKATAGEGQGRSQQDPAP